MKIINGYKINEHADPTDISHILPEGNFKRLWNHLCKTKPHLADDAVWSIYFYSDNKPAIEKRVIAYITGYKVGTIQNYMRSYTIGNNQTLYARLSTIKNVEDFIELNKTKISLQTGCQLV